MQGAKSAADVLLMLQGTRHPVPNQFRLRLGMLFTLGTQDLWQLLQVTVSVSVASLQEAMHSQFILLRNLPGSLWYCHTQRVDHTDPAHS